MLERRKMRYNLERNKEKEEIHPLQSSEKLFTLLSAIVVGTD